MYLNVAVGSLSSSCLIGAYVQDNDVTELVVKDAGHYQMLVLSNSCV
jgi:hypothetical protein